MSYRDELIRCAACGNQFVYTVKEQRRRAAQGLSKEAPVFCPECRGADVRLAGATIETDTEPEEAPAASDRENRDVASGRALGGRGVRSSLGRDGSRRGDEKGSRKSRGAQKGRPRKPSPPQQTEIRVRHLGTVKWFDDDRGFGFIAQEDGEELFVHMTSVLIPGDPPLEPGQQVEYEIARTSKGPQAVDVVPIG